MDLCCEQGMRTACTRHRTLSHVEYGKEMIMSIEDAPELVLAL